VPCLHRHADRRIQLTVGVVVAHALDDLEEKPPSEHLGEDVKEFPRFAPIVENAACAQLLDAVQLNNVVTNLIQLPKLPGSLRSSLQSFQANPEQFLASEGNELRVKGHDVLFALSSGYLLKNADSWTELVLQLP
jgi:hypothetical protein